MKTLGNKKIGVVGVGNMGASILEGVLTRRLTTPSNVWVYDKVVNRAKSFACRLHVCRASSVAELFKKTDVVLLAMKPQDLANFALEHRSSFRMGQGVISILAGMTTEKIAQALGKHVTIVRAMPNLGAKVGQSMTVICGKNKMALSFAKTLFSGCGEVVMLPEKMLDLVTAISGSGPAYFFNVMELLTDFGVKQGLPPGSQGFWPFKQDWSRAFSEGLQGILRGAAAESDFQKGDDGSCDENVTTREIQKSFSAGASSGHESK